MPVNRITRFGFVNVYLVEEEDGLTLIDAMMPAQLEGDPRRGREDREADHDDPAHPRPRRPHRLARRTARGAARGGGPDLRARLPLARQGHDARPGRAAGQAARQLPRREDEADADGHAGRAGRLARGRSPPPATRPATSPSSTSATAPSTRGDACSTLGGVATSAKMNPRFPLVGFATWHKPTALESAKALRALEPARLAPGHGKVVENPGAAMDAAIKARLTRRRERRKARRATVVAAAAEIADAEGLEAATLSRVAAELGIRPPSLYNHVESHAALMRRLRAAVLRGVRRRAPRRRGRALPARTAIRASRRRLPRLRARPPRPLRDDRPRAEPDDAEATEAAEAAVAPIFADARRLGHRRRRGDPPRPRDPLRPTRLRQPRARRRLRPPPPARRSFDLLVDSLVAAIEAQAVKAS